MFSLRIDDLGTRRVQPHIQELQTFKTSGQFPVCLRRCEKKQKASASGPKQFPAKCSGVQPSLVEFINLTAGNPAVQAALALPGLMEQLAELTNWSVAYKNIVCGVHHLPHTKEDAAVGRDLFDLRGNHVRRFPPNPGENQE